METSDNSLCPLCHTAPDPATGLCRCPAAPLDNPSPLNFSPGALVAQAESLFETYLAARLVRARRQLTVAKVALLRDPRNRTKLNDLSRAEQETHRLQAQLVEQARRAVEAKELSRAGSPSAPPVDEAAAVARTEATEHFRAAQAAKADEAYGTSSTPLDRRSRPDDRDCPRCGKRVAGDKIACPCGYQFVPGDPNVVAEPFLTEDELAALRHTLKAP